MFSENVWPVYDASYHRAAPRTRTSVVQAVETELSPSNFIFTAEDIVCYLQGFRPPKKRNLND
jgi:hypothetical protein